MSMICPQPSQIVELELPKVAFLVADGAYTGLIKWAKDNFKLDVHISKQIKEQGFIPIAHRRKVEHFISWMMWSRRLSKDYELTVESSQAWAMIHGIKNELTFFLIFNRLLFINLEFLSRYLLIIN